jgi:class 3 adenylate cyclase
MTPITEDGQILLSGRVVAAIEQMVRLEKMENLLLKGLSQPVSVQYNCEYWRGGVVS